MQNQKQKTKIPAEMRQKTISPSPKDKQMLPEKQGSNYRIK